MAGKNRLSRRAITFIVSCIVIFAVSTRKESRLVARFLSSLNFSNEMDLAISVMGFLPPKQNNPVNILALGGSVTYGDEDNWNTAYSKALGDRFYELGCHVDNLAIRASGAQIPSMCIQSMVSGDVLLRENQTNIEEKEYDVILLEFSLNGFEGLELLVHRLKKRYPNAIIVYLQLMTKKGVNEFANDGNRVDFLRMAPKTIKFLLDRDVVFYNFPRYQLQSINFEEDEKHLNKRGHGIVADGLYELIGEKVIAKKKAEEKGEGNTNTVSWEDAGGGDSCYFWFQGGNIPEETQKLLRVDDNEKQMTEFSKTKFAYETSYGEETRLEFFCDPELDDKGDVKLPMPPLYLVHMTTGTPSLYPDASIAHFHHQRLGANREIEKWEYISTKSVGAQPTINHLTEASKVGTVSPGWNRIFVKPIERKKKLPFRTVGIVISKWDYHDYEIVGEYDEVNDREMTFLRNINDQPQQQVE